MLLKANTCFMIHELRYCQLIGVDQQCNRRTDGQTGRTAFSISAF